MNDKPFNFNEFMTSNSPEKDEEVVENEEITEFDAVEAPELEVQQAVVQELAADKAALSADFESLQTHTQEVESALKKAKDEVESLKKELTDAKVALEAAKTSLSATNAALEQKAAELDAQKAKEIDLQERNPNALALLDRDVELPDRFPGETRDQVLEVIREARNKAEEEGRIRRAQLLEGVLVANEPNGNLAKKRAALEKFFNENHNIISGTVMAELDKCGISYKKGEEYLLPSEILRRTY